MKTKLLALLGAAMLLVSTSCSNKYEDNTITQQSVTNCPTYYTNIATSELKSGSTSYLIELNYTKALADITITNLTLPDGTSYPALSVKGLGFKLNESGECVVTATSVQSEITGFSNAPLVNDFKCTIVNRAIGSEYVPGFSISFNIGSFSVFATQAAHYFFGTTTSTSESNEKYTDNSVAYTYAISKELNTVTLVMSGARFVKDMPAMDITLENLPLTVEGTTFRIIAPSVTPSINGTPFPAFPITNFSAYVDPIKGSNISFTCEPATMPGKYNVVAVTTLFGTQE